MSEKTSRFIEGLFLGGLIGLCAGVLIAPKAGEEIRREIGGKAQEAYNKINHALRESRDAIEIAIAQGKNMAEETRAEVIQALDQARQKIESMNPTEE